MKPSYSFLLSLLMGTALSAYSQRYCEPVFPEIDLKKDIVYGYADRYDWWGTYDPTPLAMNLYQPKGDTLQNRPAVIMVHGGVFLIGHPKAKKDIKAWCDSLAHHGYVAINLGYRLGFDITSQASMIRAGYRAIQDVRAAVRYLKEYHALYRIDTTQIFVGGNSSGSISAIHAAFMEELERPIETYGVGKGRESCDLDCLDCSGNSYGHSADIAGVIALWGAIWEPDLIDPGENIPTLLIHGEKDHIVPITSERPFHMPFFPVLHGSRVMDQRFTELGIPHQFHEFEGKAHTFYHKRPFLDFPDEEWYTVWNLGKDFLYEQVSSSSGEYLPSLGLSPGGEGKRSGK